MPASEDRTTPAAPTRERLVEAALDLFARRGFDATSVGEIEAAAGLQPRRGGLYRHFASKDALLESVVERHIKDVTRLQFELSGVHRHDARSVTTIYARWLLQDLDGNRQLTAILEREGERMTLLRDQFRNSVDAGFKAVSSVMKRWIEDANLPLDADVVAAIVTSSIVNHRRALWTLGAAPLSLDDDRFVEGLAELVAMLFSDRSAAR